MSFFLKAMVGFGLLLPAAMTASPTIASTPRHYDCSKAGNANKAACKAAPTPAAAPAKPSRTTTTKSTTTTTTRHYDCTKAGNANKTACRTAADESPTGRASGAVKKTTTTTTSTVDCGKWYNGLRSACRATKATSPPRTTVAPAAKPARPEGPRGGIARPIQPSPEAVNTDSRGATAQCKDGTFSHAANHRGACSHHGGVAKWLQG